MRSGIFLSILLLSLTAPASAESLSASKRLRKLSLHLRGVPASWAEFQDLEASKTSGKLPEFFVAKAKEYAESPAFAGRMHERLSELFRVRPIGVPVDLVGTAYETSTNDMEFKYNSFNEIFSRILEANLSWDTLLLSKNYKAFTSPPYAYALNTDFGFFAAVTPELPPATDGVFRVKEVPQFNSREGKTFIVEKKKIEAFDVIFEPSDERVAGVLTTSRFAMRYTNGAINENRRRAAAVFRIFLCDDMEPAIMPSKEEDEDLLRQAVIDKEDAPKRNHIKAATANELHGSDAACMSCHYKLDPMGKTFNSLTTILETNPSPGALVFRDSKGSMVNIPVAGIGGLGRAIVAQPDYAACQVSRFWNWFIGEDVPLMGARKKEAIEAFDALGRRPRDFAVWLVSQPEFFGDGPVKAKREAPKTFASVSNGLAKCASCHSAQPAIADFRQIPFGGSPESHIQWIEAIARELDLAGTGLEHTMPPASAGWKPQETEDLREAIRNWACQGAPDEVGIPTIDARKLEKGVCKP